MSILFTPIRFGSLEIKNRFIQSATYEVMADTEGNVTDTLINRYRALARGEVGLVIPGYMYVHPLGRSYRHQTGIHSDRLIPGLRKLTRAVHEEGGKIVFQLAHAGRQTTKEIIGNTPLAPSSYGRDPVNFVKPKEMNAEEIEETIQSFQDAARRAVEAGADGVQLHAAHGYLINQFLSPFFNRRSDEWGGSDENRFRFLREIVVRIKDILPPDKPLLVKLNTHDHTPSEGVTPPIASRYARWLKEIGVDGIEVSAGTALYSFMNVSRGEVPERELLRSLPIWKRPIGILILRNMRGRFGFSFPYNVDAARLIKPHIGDTPLILVGGVRRLSDMETLIKEGITDCISMSRPFIREPSLVKQFREGKKQEASCISCNRCLAAVTLDIPVRCYVRGLPYYYL